MSQRLSALLELCADKVAMSPQQQDLLVTCLREVGSLLSKLADDKQADGPVARLRDVADANSEEHALQVRAAPAVPCCARDRGGRSWIPTTQPRRRTFAQFSA
jgi:hypothetical protein